MTLVALLVVLSYAIECKQQSVAIEIDIVDELTFQLDGFVVLSNALPLLHSLKDHGKSIFVRRRHSVVCSR